MTAKIKTVEIYLDSLYFLYESLCTQYLCYLSIVSITSIIIRGMIKCLIRILIWTRVEVIYNEEFLELKIFNFFFHVKKKRNGYLVKLIKKKKRLKNIFINVWMVILFFMISQTLWTRLLNRIHIRLQDTERFVGVKYRLFHDYYYNIKSI